MAYTEHLPVNLTLAENWMRGVLINLFLCFLLRICSRFEPSKEAVGTRWLMKMPGSGNYDIFSQQTPGSDRYSAYALIYGTCVALCKCTWKIVCTPPFRLSSHQQMLLLSAGIILGARSPRLVRQSSCSQGYSSLLINPNVLWYMVWRRTETIYFWGTSRWLQGGGGAWVCFWRVSKSLHKLTMYIILQQRTSRIFQS